MSLKEHAQRELTLACLFDKDSDYEGMLGEAVMRMIEVFSAEKHSGSSAAQTINIFKRVANYECLTPLTGKDDEWVSVAAYGNGNPVWQNNRVSSVFKDKDGKAYYLNGVVWKTQKGTTWFGEVDGIASRQYIKAFPFTPKTFYIDVTENEVSKDNWEFHIVDMKQLEPVKEYYLLVDSN